MMKYTLLSSVFCFLFYDHAFTQQDSRILEWVSGHPSVYIFSEANYSQLSSDFKSKLQDRVVVYKDKLLFEDLIAFDGLEKAEAVSMNSELKDEDVQLIKNWLAFHQDVKIIRRSEFQTMPEERKNLYQSENALILIGEYLTVQDITNYLY
ncbi:hypothetical protein [Fluviicola sp.]|uniref:hypothetical protein n=1 Tax=Fluviicola sp. TaxID=1917219 RepID=UPI0031D529F2